MKIESKVGLEAEFLLRNTKGDIIIPPASWDRDGFPLLGEIRGTEGKTVAETVSNFRTTELEINEKLRSGHTLEMTDLARVSLKLYKEANKQIDWEEKEGDMDKVKNIHGVDITDFSDQVIEKGKIQGINVSCGLHVHFSCGVLDEYEYEEPVYEQVLLPIGLSMAATEDIAAKSSNFDVANELLKPVIYLYRHAGYKKNKKISVSASRLCKPAIEYIVKEMDAAFFERFAPDKKSRTKYRQPGFYEPKAYGFEYRSLPANRLTMEALPEITRKAFDLLKEINS